MRNYAWGHPNLFDTRASYCSSTPSTEVLHAKVICILYSAKSDHDSGVAKGTGENVASIE